MRSPLQTVLSAFALLSIAGVAAAEPLTFVIDRSHSEVGFNVRHFFAKTHGSFSDFDGKIVYDPKSLTASSVEVTIRDSSISTAHNNRDRHLRTEDFFWVEKHPLITFKSTKVVPGKEPNHFNVLGDLTIRGVTKPVTLETEMLGMGKVVIGGKDQGTRAGFSAKTKVDRKDFGIVWNKTLDQEGVVVGNAMLGDEVEIVLSIEAFTPSPATAKPPAASADKK